MSGGCFWFWSCVCVCGWMRRVRLIPPPGEGRPWPEAEPHTLTAGVDLNCAPPWVTSPSHTHRHVLLNTHQETAYSLLHVFTEEPQTPEEEKAKYTLSDTDTQTRAGEEEGVFFRVYFTCVVNRKIG